MKPRIPNDRDIFALKACGVTSFGTPVHVYGATSEWKRQVCQCGAQEAEMVDGKPVVRDVLN